MPEGLSRADQMAVRQIVKNIVSANEDKKDGGKLVIETLGKPCPKCSDYAEKMKELAAKSAS